MATRKITIIAVAFAALMSAGCAGGPRESGIDRRNLQRFGVLPEAISNQAGTSSAALVSLGRMLYFDARLSKSQTVSCNSCHPLDKYGADGQPTSTGYRGQHGERNSPTVYNAATQFVQFWDGRAPNVEEQAKGPLLNPVEMAMPSGKAVVDVLKSMPQYVAAFRRAFPGERNPVTFNHAAEAIGAFERGLLTPARWDQYLRGEEAALTAREKGGLTVFMQEGCATCHTGALVGGDSYQRLGALKSYPDTSDPGRYRLTKIDDDRMLFKVPSLRNIAMTGPYFHNGKVATLQEAVAQMADYQLGKKLSARKADAIVAWLQSLTGQLPGDYIKPPDLPRSTSRTPGPVTAD